MDAAIGEDQLAMVKSPVRHAVRTHADFESGRAHVDQQRGDLLLGAVLGLLFPGGGKEDGEIGDIGIADEMLGAVDHEMIALAHGPGLHRAQIGARTRLGEGQAFDALAADGRQQIALDLLARAGAQDIGRPRHGVLKGEGGAAQLALHQGHAHCVQPAAAQLLRHVGGIESGGFRPLADLGDQVRGHLVGALHFGLMGHQLLLDEGADRVDQHALLVAGREIHEAISGEGRPF